MWVFEASKPTLTTLPVTHPSNMATPLKPSQIVLPAGDLVFKYMSPFSFKLPHLVSLSSWHSDWSHMPPFFTTSQNQIVKGFFIPQLKVFLNLISSNAECSLIIRHVESWGFPSFVVKVGREKCFPALLLCSVPPRWFFHES